VIRGRGAPSICTVYIRAATPEDAETLTDLHLDVWDDAYTGLVPAQLLLERRANRAGRIDRWHQILGSQASTEWVAQREPDDPRLLGFASTGAGRDEPEPGLPRLELMALYVRAEAYGSGIGYALYASAIGDSSAFLWVLDGNVRAIRFYERQGFAFDGKSRTEPEGVERRMTRGGA
jgi:GNAT superfamily N-acetyltransferase